LLSACRALVCGAVPTGSDDDDDDDEADAAAAAAGDCLVVDCNLLSIKSYSLSSAPDSPIVDVSWSLDATRLITVAASVRISLLILTLITTAAYISISAFT